MAKLNLDEMVKTQKLKINEFMKAREIFKCMMQSFHRQIHKSIETKSKNERIWMISDL